MLINQGKEAQAEPILRRVLSADPGGAEPLLLLGVIHGHRKQFGKAITLTGKSIALDPSNPAAFFNMGCHYRDAGNKQLAHGFWMKALELNPQHLGCLNNLCLLYMDAGKFDKAEEFIQKALAADPSSLASLANLGTLFTRQKRIEEARRVFEKILAKEPGNASAHHFFNAFGADGAETAPKGYVAGLFDGYAEKFDKHLVEGLRYRAPQGLREAVGRVLGGNPPKLKVIDLGCGTGLSGAQFRDLAGHLAGVDLSPGMLAKARERKVYDKLHKSDLTQALTRYEGELDLAVSADVLIYVGGLEKVFEACAAALRAGGLFAFTTEDIPGEGFILRHTGRFAHSDSYIMGLAGKNGFTLVLRDEIILRMESGKPLSGHAYVLCKGEMAPQAESRPADSGPAGIEEIYQEAFLHHQAGHAEKAEALYRQVLQRDPGHASALHSLGVLARETGHHEAAAELIQAAIQRRPGVPAFHTNLGLAYYGLGKMEDAVAAMGRALRLNPSSWESHTNLANLLKLQGKPGEAAKYLLLAVRLHPACAQAHNNLAVVLCEQGKVEEAETHYKRAVELDPEYADGAGNYARFLRKQERFEEAAAQYKRLVKLRPGDAEARRRLEECEAQAAQP
ncbi:MAG: tetratricopeptide repeat protein [Candidatus Tectomicrobia bacterium]|nr:tetratricopeptide repeat protein [Candidatus Tectomicrobia bacterium]